MKLEGITHHRCLNQISRVKKRLNQLRSIGLNNTGFHAPSRRTYIALVRSIKEYQIHLTPCPNTLAIAYQSSENEFFNAVGVFKWRKDQCWRKAFNLLPAAYRRARLRGILRSRVSHEERTELSNLLYALTRERNLDVSPELESEWNRADEGKVRQLPLPSFNSLILVLCCRKKKHRALELQWSVHWFPRNRTAIR